MIYQQAVLLKEGRFNTARALLEEHFARVARDTGCEFGELEIDQPRHYSAGIQILNVFAEIKKPMERTSYECSEEEYALMEAMWVTIH